MTLHNYFQLYTDTEISLRSRGRKNGGVVCHTNKCCSIWCLSWLDLVAERSWDQEFKQVSSARLTMRLTKVVHVVIYKSQNKSLVPSRYLCGLYQSVGCTDWLGWNSVSFLFYSLESSSSRSLPLSNLIHIALECVQSLMGIWKWS